MFPILNQLEQAVQNDKKIFSSMKRNINLPGHI